VPATSAADGLLYLQALVLHGCDMRRVADCFLAGMQLPLIQLIPCAVIVQLCSSSGAESGTLLVPCLAFRM
jgi:hypothetical protein